MYCRNCGTVVNGNEELCEACRMEQIIHKSETPRIDMSGECRGAAITSAALGFGSLFLAIGAFASIAARSGMVTGLLLIGALACIVIAILLGIKGISAFRRAGLHNAIRPIASLVCGIIGVSLAGFSAIYWFFALVALFFIA